MLRTVQKVEDVEGNTPEVKSENLACLDAETPTVNRECTGLSFPAHNNLNNFKIDQQRPDTNTHNNILTSLLNSSKSDTYILNTTHAHYQLQYNYKSDTGIHKITQDQQHIIDILKHTATEDTADRNQLDTEMEKMTASSDSVNKKSAQYEEDDVSLSEVVSTNLPHFEDSDIKPDEMKRNTNDDDDYKEEFYKAVTPQISDSFDKLAAQYEDSDVDLDELVRINLPYCVDEDIDLDMLVANNIPTKSDAAKSKNVKTLIELFDQSK